MKRKTTALLLALSMCLSLLTACGSGNTAADEKPPESGNAASSTEQQPDESKQPEESEESKEEEPEESGENKEDESDEPADPSQGEPKEESNAGTEFLALLQEEYKAGMIEGFTQEHMCLNYRSLASTYIWADLKGENIYITIGGVYSYNIPTKTTTEYGTDGLDQLGTVILDGWNYTWDESRKNIVKFKPGEEIIVVSGAVDYDSVGAIWGSTSACRGDKIIFPGVKESTILSLDSGLVDVVPSPQKEVEHGLTEAVSLDFDYENGYLIADGTVYAKGEDHLYRLDVEALEWIELGPDNGLFNYNYRTFYGKYCTDEKGVYNRITGEQVFEYGELYPSISLSDSLSERSFCYWGGDKYLGYKDGEYRWVNLTDLSMSDPLPFPERKWVTILNDTYCVYKDEYGWFLWNYNTGEEETIVMYDR